VKYVLESIIPKRDWALVVCDPRPETVGGLFLPQEELGVEKVMERSGKVLRLGPGDKWEKLDLKEGDRIIFRGFIKHASPIESEDGREAFLMDLDDIIAVADEDVTVGAFSRPAMSAVELVDAEGKVVMK
jgi:co-chaperonin GroES (HSP10)